MKASRLVTGPLVALAILAGCGGSQTGVTPQAAMTQPSRLQLRRTASRGCCQRPRVKT